MAQVIIYPCCKNGLVCWKGNIKLEIKVNASVFEDELQEYSVKELRYGLAPLVEGYWIKALEMSEGQSEIGQLLLNYDREIKFSFPKIIFNNN